MYSKIVEFQLISEKKVRSGRFSLPELTLTLSIYFPLIRKQIILATLNCE